MWRSRSIQAKACEIILHALCLMATIFYIAPPTLAQRIPITSYDVRNGLANNWVSTIYHDSKGYLWVGTWEGLSRFDGYKFTNYGLADGLPSIFITAITEDRHGRLWVATPKGIARLIDTPEEISSLRRTVEKPKTLVKFKTYTIGDSADSNSVSELLFDSDGLLWCASRPGIYRARIETLEKINFELVVPCNLNRPANASLIDSRGRVWFGVEDTLIRIEKGRIIKYTPPVKSRSDDRTFLSITEYKPGRLLINDFRFIFEFTVPDDMEGSADWKSFPIDLVPGQEIRSLLADSSGSLWIGTTEGLIKYRDGRSTLYTRSQGLRDNLSIVLGEDREGSIWITPGVGGISRVSGEMIISYTKEDNLPEPNVVEVIESREGRIYATTIHNGFLEIRDHKVVPIPGSSQPPFNIVHKRILQDRRGDWWIGTNRGLYRFPGPELRLKGGKRFTEVDGISGKAIMTAPGMYEDTEGSLWFSSGDYKLYRYDPEQKGRKLFEAVLAADANSPYKSGAIDMVLDRSGVLWTISPNGITRFKDRQIREVRPNDGLPDTHARCVFKDSRGWLWIALLSKGVSVTTDPEAETPHFKNYSTENGLVSDNIWSITEDDQGRIYLGTGRGLDQLNPSTGRIRHIGSEDGLACDLIHDCMKDSKGYIWVATCEGISRYNPRAEKTEEKPSPIFLSRIQVAGEDLPLPETGVLKLPPLQLSSTKNNLFIEYVGLNLWSSRKLRYQYRLENVDSNWNGPTESRSINYANLAPGSYRFLVRVVNLDNLASSEPAVVEFRILPPFWQQWWFITLVLGTLIAGALALHRFRIRQILKLERIRRQIAIDLHDDMGSGLAQVAVLSEVAKRDASTSTSELLAEVADLARSMRESMSDIVWAIDPRKDSLEDLLQRMKQVAFNVLEAEGVRVDFYVPGEAIEKIDLTPDGKRHLLLIFKEAVTNIARHSGATNVRARIELSSGGLYLTIQDNGCGFDPNSQFQGNGLQSIRQRAGELKAELKIKSDSARGTIIELFIPEI